MKGVKGEALATAPAKKERKPRKERARRIQHVTAAVAARSLKATLALLAEDYPETADIKRKTDLLSYLCNHEEAAQYLAEKLQQD